MHCGKAAHQRRFPFMPSVSGNHPHTTVPLSPEGRTARTLHPIATIKKQPDPFPLDQAVFFFPIHGNGRTNAIQSPPHLFPSIPRQAQQTKGLLPCSLPTSRKSWERRGCGGGITLLQKGFPPPPIPTLSLAYSSTALPQATRPDPTRRRQTIYS